MVDGGVSVGSGGVDEVMLDIESRSSLASSKLHIIYASTDLPLGRGVVVANAVEQELALPKKESLCAMGLCVVGLCDMCVVCFLFLVSLLSVFFIFIVCVFIFTKFVFIFIKCFLSLGLF